MILIKIPGLGDPTVQVVGYDDGTWFGADAFGFGVEREMRESGEKGGTEDINIGVGELQECSISKSMDWSSPLLAQLAVNGNSPGTCQIDFVSVGGKGKGSKPVVHLRYVLDRCFVKSWSTSGGADERPTEEVELYFNKIAFAVGGQPSVFSWDRTKQIPWPGHGLDPNQLGSS